MLSKNNRFIGAILLVSGTTIGAGMLALPLTTGLAGFFPALCIMTAVWLFMLLTAFYLLEVNLRMRGESNLISMMGKTLGSGGQVVSWVIYLLLLYSLMAAYMMGCSQILNDLIPLPDWNSPLIVFAIFAVVVYFGTGVVDFLNRTIMVGLILSYLCILALGLRHVTPPLLTHIDWRYLFPSLSVVMVTFGYHIIIPTLTTYLDHDTKLLKRAIFIGSLIPFVIYIFWQFLVMGIVPSTGEVSILKTASNGEQITGAMKKILGSVWIGFSMRLFAFFAIVTSLLGVSLSLHDFLADGLKIKKKGVGKLLIVILTFFPPLFFALFYPNGFLIALKYAGVFVVILLAIFPTAMVWFERYGKQTERSFIKSDFKVTGGKPLLILAFILSFALLGLELFA